MDTSGRFRILENLEGQGQVWNADSCIASVRYSLKEAMEIPWAESKAADGGVDPASSTLGVRSIFGLLRTAAAPALSVYAGATLHLELQDGRKLPFTVAKQLDARSCLILALGDFA